MVKRNAVFTGIAAFVVLLFTGCGGPQGSGTLTVEGTVVDPCGAPQPYATVFITGQAPSLTDAEGRFTFDDVSTPYDLVVAGASLFNEDPEDNSILVYQGLSRTDPVITARVEGSPVSGCKRLEVSGTITPARDSSAYRNGAGIVAGLAAKGNNFAYDSNPSYRLRFNYEDGVTNATLFAMQWRRDTSTWDAVEYLGYTRQQLTLGDESSLTRDLDLTSPMESRPVEVTLAAGAPFPLESIGQFVSVDGENLNIRTARVYAEEVTDGVYKFIAPKAEGIGPVMVARAYYGEEVSGGSVNTADLSGVDAEILFWKRLGEDEDAVEMVMPDPVVPVSPLPGGRLGDAASARFTWSGPEDAIYDVVFGFEEAEYSIEVITSKRSLALPDLSGMSFLYGNEPDQMYWSIYALGGQGVPADMDGVADESTRAFAFDYDRQLAHTEAGYFILVDAGVFQVGTPDRD